MSGCFSLYLYRIICKIRFNNHKRNWIKFSSGFSCLHKFYCVFISSQQIYSYPYHNHNKNNNNNVLKGLRLVQFFLYLLNVHTHTYNIRITGGSKQMKFCICVKKSAKKYNNNIFLFSQFEKGTTTASTIPNKHVAKLCNMLSAFHNNPSNTVCCAYII